MSILPYLILGLGLYWVLLLLTSQDNVVVLTVREILRATSEAAERVARAMQEMTRAVRAAAPAFAEIAESMKLFGAAFARPRVDRVLVADRESLHRLTRDIGARSASEASFTDMLPLRLVGIPVVIDPDVEAGVVVLMLEGEPVGRIKLSHFVGDAGEPPFENGWGNA